MSADQSGQRRDIVAFTGLLLAVIFPPFGLALSMWALERTRTRPGRHLAVAGTTISAALLLVAALWALLLW